MGLRGRKPRPSLPVDLYLYAERIYWEFRSLGENFPSGDRRSDEAGPIYAVLQAAPVWTSLWTPRPKSAEQLTWLASLFFPPAQESLWPDQDTVPESEVRLDFPNVQYCLMHYADQLAEAMKYPLFPRSKRPGNRFRQLWFISRALAAAHCKTKLTTALKLVNASRPEERALRSPRRARTVRTPAPAPAV
jgi:hypothetical protein